MPRSCRNASPQGPSHQNNPAQRDELSRGRSQSITIPDGGLLAWSQCAGSFFLLFNSFGIINSFGQFLACAANFHHRQYLMLDRRLPNILRTDSHPKPTHLQYRLDWVYTSFSLLKRGDRRRSFVRSWLPSLCRHRW